MVLSVLVSTLPLPVAAADSQIEFTNIIVDNIDEDSALIVWNTNINTVGKIYFGENKDNLTYYIGDSESSRYHKTEIANLKDDTKYYFLVQAQSSGKVSRSFVYSFETHEEEDTTRPSINDVKAIYVSATAAVLAWKTNENATSRILFDENETYKHSAGNNTRVTSHQVVIKNLKPGTWYYAYVFSVDKEGNRSSNVYIKFYTKNDAGLDSAVLDVTHLRPSGPNDSYIGSDSLKVTYQTNHWAKGFVRLKTKGEKDVVINMGYETKHEADFSGLIANRQYEVIVNMTDIFGKNRKRAYYINTKAAAAAGTGSNSGTQADNTVVSQATRSLASCESEYLTQTGFYGKYFNLPQGTPLINTTRPGKIGEATGWYDDQYLSFKRVDGDLKFGDKFFPVNEGEWKDPFYFSVYWRAIVSAPENGKYEYNIWSDDDAVVYIDKVLVTDLRGKHVPKKSTSAIDLDTEYHLIEIYYADRGPGTAHFYFNPDERLVFYPWPEECGDNLDFNGSNNFGNNSVNSGSNPGISGDGEGNVDVAGVEYSYYTPATALYRTPESPDVYAIVNGQRHYISSPASFNKYGYKWEDIKLISKSELEKYPRARLLRTPDDPTIYFLYQRPENQWLKIDLNSPTVFVSYADNYWGNVIKVTQEDIDAYPKVQFLRKNNEPAIYYLDKTVKRQISDNLFRERGYNPYNVVSVNSVHFESYKTEESVK